MNSDQWSCRCSDALKDYFEALRFERFAKLPNHHFYEFCLYRFVFYFNTEVKIYHISLIRICRQHNCPIPCPMYTSNVTSPVSLEIKFMIRFDQKFRYQPPAQPQITKLESGLVYSLMEDLPETLWAGFRIAQAGGSIWNWNGSAFSSTIKRSNSMMHDVSILNFYDYITSCYWSSYQLTVYALCCYARLKVAKMKLEPSY